MAKARGKPPTIKRINKTKHSDAIPRTANVPVNDRLQKKIAKRVQFLERVAATSSSTLKAKGGVSKRKASAAGSTLADLSSLSGALQDVIGSSGRSGSGKSGAKAGSSGKAAGDTLAVGACKKRGRIMRQETSRLQQVLQHPVFQKDPFAAVTAHLQATMPEAPAPPKAPLKPEELRTKRREKKRRQRQRAAEGVVGMSS